MRSDVVRDRGGSGGQAEIISARMENDIVVFVVGFDKVWSTFGLLSQGDHIVL